MRPIELESRILNIVGRILEGQHVEDSLIELKSEWPRDPAKVARRLAGHCNAAGGEKVLWIIGIDEKSKAVTGAAKEELADWWPQVSSKFDGIAPDLLRDLAVPVEDKTVVGLLFDTERAPYVVTNADGGPVSHELPWREGTRVRSARREDLVRLLSPTGGTEDAHLSFTPPDESAFSLALDDR